MRRLAVAAMAAALTTFTDFGLSRGAPKLVRRGSLDLSSPYIPPAPRRATMEEKRVIRDRMRLAEAKRVRKAEKLKALVAKGAMAAA